MLDNPAEQLSALEVRLFTNVDESVILDQVRAAAKRGLPLLMWQPPHDRDALLVGGGPSLADTLDDLRARVLEGADVFALNNAAAWLRARGIVSRYQVILDAREPNAAFVTPADPAIEYLIASQCHPAVFDALAGQRIQLFYQNYGGRSGVHLPPGAPLLGAGTTVGLKAMQIAHVLGYRVQHLYGFDSSYRDAEAHAYPQIEDARESAAQEVIVLGRTFRSAYWMVGQANAFPSIATELAEYGAEIQVHGTGLLPHIAAKMAEGPVKDDALTMLYDLSHAPASYNFLEWLLNAALLRRQQGVSKLRVCIAPGPNGGFRDDDLPETHDQRRMMLENVMRPALGLVGAEEASPHEMAGGCPYVPRMAVDGYLRGEGITRWRPSDEARAWAAGWLADRGLDRPIIITLRETSYWSARNSNLADWLAFADSLTRAGEQVVIVRDTAKADEFLPGFVTCPQASVDLHRRCALYETAKLNAMVSNGPGILAVCLETSNPLLVIGVGIEYVEGGVGSADWYRENQGISPGEGYPWLLSTQRIVWEPDTLANLTRAYEALRPLL